MNTVIPMSENKQSLNWRQLKQELFCHSPTTRTSNTFIHSDIFNAKHDSIPSITPQKINTARQNDTSKSHILDKSDVKNEYPSNPPGKKTFKQTSDIFGDGPKKKQSKGNKHKMEDHQKEFFYGGNLNGSLSARYAKEAKKNNNVSQSIAQRIKLKSPKIIKQQEMYSPEIIQKSQQCDQTNQFPPFYITREFRQESYNTQDKRILHNESNIFNSSPYEQKHSPRVNKDEQSERFIDQTQQKEIDQIKKQNHNFSNVFGLSYGTKGQVSHDQGEQKPIATDTNWMHIDTIRDAIEIGRRIKTGLTPRSKAMELKSQLDNPSYYDKIGDQKSKRKPSNKSIKMNQTHTFLRTKQQKHVDLITLSKVSKSRQKTK